MYVITFQHPPCGAGSGRRRAARSAAWVASPFSALPAAAQGAPAATAAAGLPLPHDLSAWSMFLHADAVVKAVMVGLALASVATWALLIGKGAALASGTARARRAAADIAEADTLDGLAAPGRLRGPAAALVAAARDEAERSAALPPEGVKERAALSLGRMEARAARAMARGTGVLATVGSVAPFVGLFGTVWGIMDSFVGISRAHTSNLAVVAPGIAEALLATAIGLVAAIPAVVIFNGFARGIAGYRALLGDASAEVMRLLSRDLDRREAARAAGSAAGSMAGSMAGPAAAPAAEAAE